MSREIHKETATTVGTGLMINYPLNEFLLFLFIDVFAWNNTFLIGTVVTGIITIVAYTRVYTIRKWFNNRGWMLGQGQENDRQQIEHYLTRDCVATVFHPARF